MSCRDMQGCIVPMTFLLRVAHVLNIHVQAMRRCVDTSGSPTCSNYLDLSKQVHDTLSFIGALGNLGMSYMAGLCMAKG